jgi:hypothetical protein
MTGVENGMGKIIQENRKVVIEMSVDEALMQIGYIMVSGKKLTEYVGNFLSKAAWDILKTKAPHLLRIFTNGAQATKIEGEGTVKVTFSAETNDAINSVGSQFD